MKGILMNAFAAPQRSSPHAIIRYNVRDYLI